MPPATTPASPSYAGDANAAYPSRDIAFRAAGMITSIVENLQAHDELKFTPAFMYVDLVLNNLGLYTNVHLVCTVFSRP